MGETTRRLCVKRGTSAGNRNVLPFDGVSTGEMIFTMQRTHDEQRTPFGGESGRRRSTLHRSTPFYGVAR